jgi:hypothetical protein
LNLRQPPTLVNIEHNESMDGGLQVGQKWLRAELNVDKLVLKDIRREMISVQFVDRTVANTATAPRSRSMLWPIFVLTFSLDPSRPAG